MKYVFKLVLPAIILITIAGIIVMSMPNPNPVIVVGIYVIITLILIARLKSIKKNAKKHLRNAAKSSSKHSSNNISTTKYAKSTNNNATIPAEAFYKLAKDLSGVEKLTSHADIAIKVTYLGDEEFSIETRVLPYSQEGCGIQEDSAEQSVITHLKWKIDEGIEDLHRKFKC